MLEHQRPRGSKPRKQVHMSILEQHGLSDKTFKLGRVCKHGHDWKGTGHSLRYVKKSSCIDCLNNGPRRRVTEARQLALRKVKLEESKLIELEGLDPEKFYLGRLCPAKHEWNRTGKTLRYKSRSRCPKCRGVQMPGIGKNGIRFTTEERFWRHVNKQGTQTEYLDTRCWDWTGCLVHGYGNFDVRKEGFTLAHRYSYWLHTKEELGALYVCHKCHNPKCVNPDHIYLGTPADNVRDMVDSLRVQHGETASGAKLTKTQVLEMYDEYHASDISLKDLGIKYGVNKPTVHKILNGDRWKHLNLEVKPRKKSNAKLTEESVIWLRSLDIPNNPSWTYTAVAKHLNVTRKAVEKAAKRENWKHVV